jgi:hypothetical protein
MTHLPLRRQIHGSTRTAQHAPIRQRRSRARLLPCASSSQRRDRSRRRLGRARGISHGAMTLLPSRESRRGECRHRHSRSGRGSTAPIRQARNLASQRNGGVRRVSCRTADCRPAREPTRSCRGVRSVGAWQQWQRSRFARDRTGSAASARIPANWQFQVRVQPCWSGEGGYWVAAGVCGDEVGEVVEERLFSESAGDGGGEESFDCAFALV